MQSIREFEKKNNNDALFAEAKGKILAFSTAV